MSFLPFPSDFPPPNVPDNYRLIYEGMSSSYEGERYGAVRRMRSGNLPARTVCLFYTNGCLSVAHDPNNCDRVRFPSRQEMYNYIETMCVLNTWENSNE
jgi:hypothetical protein